MIKKVVGFLGDIKTVTPPEIREQLEDKIVFLPGDEWPERVFLESLKRSDNLDNLINACNIDTISEIKKYITTAIAAGKHSEFFQLANDLCLEEGIARTLAIRQYHALNETEAKPIIDAVKKALP